MSILEWLVLASNILETYFLLYNFIDGQLSLTHFYHFYDVWLEKRNWLCWTKESGFFFFYIVWYSNDWYLRSYVGSDLLHELSSSSSVSHISFSKSCILDADWQRYFFIIDVLLDSKIISRWPSADFEYWTGPSEDLLSLTIWKQERWNKGYWSLSLLRLSA